jgi:alkanesulfonate monooxygenase SsuD/methylene tetrahydromethanopterin reductase-like flavin-dependent oxidoreductase (luciferase family)
VAAGVPFEKRTGALLEGLRLCQALWTGEPVDWDGRWQVSGATLAPVPHRPGGPPIWIGGSAPRVRERAGQIFDGWIPVSPDADTWGAHWTEIRDHTKQAGRDPASVTASVCLNLSIDDAVANRHLDTYLAQYYGVRDGTAPRQTHGSYAGPAAGAAEWLDGFARAGVEHFVLRFAGNNDHQLEVVAALRADLRW